MLYRLSLVFLAQILVVSSLVSNAFPAEKTPSMLPVIPEPVTSFGATYHKGKVYYYGGHFGQAHRYSTADQANTLWELNLNSYTWEKIGTGPRLQGLALVGYRNSLYRIGGFTAQNEPGEEHDLWSQKSFARFNLRTKKWEDLADLPEGRSSFDATVSESGMLYVVGGWQMRGDSESIWHLTAWRFDLKNPHGTWTAIANFPYKRRAISIAPTNEGVVVVGGMQDTGKITPKTVFYNARDNQWVDGPELVGESEMTGFGTASCQIDGSLIVSAYDGTLQTINQDGVFEVVGNSHEARFFHRVVPTRGKQALILGGANMETGKFDSMESIHLDFLPKLYTPK